MLMEALKKGLVYHVYEEGIGADQGSSPVTFRYRARQVTIVIDRAGRVLHCEWH
jgi:hypothetical protein